MKKTWILALLMVFGATSLAAQTKAPVGEAQLSWKLPQGVAVQEAGARRYRFTVDYDNNDAVGKVIMRQRLTATYTRGLANHQSRWNDVAQATAMGADNFGAAQKRDFMEGFRYNNLSIGDTTAPEFFKGFPPTAVFERNLVWDTAMFEYFGQHFFEHLELNAPYHSAANDAVKMPGVGVFTNHDIVLEWVGLSRRNGELCAVITYNAYENPIDIDMGGMKMKARSDYWGEIWVSLRSKQIEHATLQETVIGQMQLPGQSTAQPLHMFRHGVFEVLGE